MGKKGDYEKEDESVDTDTDNPHKHECERNNGSDIHVLMTAKIMYANEMQGCHAFVDDKVPIIDLGTLRAVIMAMHDKQRITLKPCNFGKFNWILLYLVFHDKRHGISKPEKK